MLCRTLLDEGATLREWKRANVGPIFKKGDGEIALNYRLVSLTSVICNLLENSIRKQMTDWEVKAS